MRCAGGSAWSPRGVSDPTHAAEIIDTVSVTTNLVDFDILERADHIEPAIHEGFTGRYTYLPLCTDAGFVLAGTHIKLEALELTIKNEVDHSAHGIRTVSRGCSACHHIYIAHQRRWQQVRIDGACLVRRLEPMTIQQHQCAVAAKTAQVQKGVCITGRTETAAVRGLLRSAVVEKLRQRAELLRNCVARLETFKLGSGN